MYEIVPDETLYSKGSATVSGEWRNLGGAGILLRSAQRSDIARFETARGRLMGGWIGIAAVLLGGLTPEIAGDPPAPGRAVRFATFNASLNREHSGDLLRDLATPENP